MRRRPLSKTKADQVRIARIKAAPPQDQHALGCSFFKGEGAAHFSRVVADISAYRTRGCWSSFDETRLAEAKSLEAGFQRFLQANCP